MKSDTGEFLATGQIVVTIYHNLGVTPTIFALYTEDEVTNAKGTINTILFNSGKKTRYTSAVSKSWSECSATISSDGVNDVAYAAISSVAYGVQVINEEKIVINQPANGQVFVAGKNYKWVAIAI